MTIAMLNWFIADMVRGELATRAAPPPDSGQAAAQAAQLAELLATGRYPRFAAAITQSGPPDPDVRPSSTAFSTAFWTASSESGQQRTPSYPSRWFFLFLGKKFPGLKQRGVLVRLCVMNLLSARQTRDDEGAAARLGGGRVRALRRARARADPAGPGDAGRPRRGEDVVHDAFAGLCRRWGHVDRPGQSAGVPALLGPERLPQRAAAAGSSRRRPGLTPGDEALDSPAPGADADGPLLASEDRRAVLAALRRLPDRQREVLVLRYYLDLSGRGDRAGHGDPREHGPVHRAPRPGRAERILTGESP